MLPGCFPPFKPLSLSHQIESRLMQNADRFKIPSSLVLIRHILTPGCKYFPFSQNIYHLSPNQAIHLDDVDIDCVSPITAHCAPSPGCLVGTIITSTIESHLPCFDKSTSSDTRQMAPASLHLSLVMVDITRTRHTWSQSGQSSYQVKCSDLCT